MLFNSCFAKLWHAFALLVLQYIPAIYPLAKEKCFLSCVNECCDILFFIFLSLSASCWFSQHCSSSLPSSRRSNGKRCAPHSEAGMKPSRKRFEEGTPLLHLHFYTSLGLAAKWGGGWQHTGAVGRTSPSLNPLPQLSRAVDPT